ncbi:MAG TPA: hypothetical protein ACQGQH_09690 [Xylella sp.]
MIKTGGVSAKGLSDNSFFFGMMHMMQEMGGHRVGTSLMSGYQNWIMGRTTQQVAEEMVKSGMIDPSQAKYGKTGHITKVLPGALQNAQMFRENPFEYLEKVVLPQARARGVQDGQPMTDYLDRLYSNRTWGNLLNTMYRERANIHKHIAAGGQAAGIDALAKIGAGGLSGKEIDYEAKLANLKLVLGEKILPLAVYGLEKLISTLDGLTAFARAWPTLTKGFAVLSGLAVVAGSLLLLASAFRALTVAWQFTRLGVVFRGLMSGVGVGLSLAGQAVLFLGRALLMNPIGLIITGIAMTAFLLWQHWDSLKPKLLELWERIKTGFHTFIHMSLSGWQWLFNVLIDGINKLLPKAMALNRVTFADDYATSHRPQKGGRPYVVPSKGHTLQVNTVLNMDGRQVATAVTTHQAREANRPGMGAPTFDPTRAPKPVGLGYAR